MLKIFHESDRVIIDLCGRRRDVLLSCLQADDVANALDENAGRAERELPSLIRGEQWGCKVESYDRQVAIRFQPPLGATTNRVTLPADAARKMAELIRFKESQARHGMRFVVGA